MKRYFFIILIIANISPLLAQKKDDNSKICGCYKMWDYETYYIISENKLTRFGLSYLEGFEMSIDTTDYIFNNDTLVFSIISYSYSDNKLDTIFHKWIYDNKARFFRDHEIGEYLGDCTDALNNRLKPFGLMFLDEKDKEKSKKHQKRTKQKKNK